MNNENENKDTMPGMPEDNQNQETANEAVNTPEEDVSPEKPQETADEGGAKEASQEKGGEKPKKAKRSKADNRKFRYGSMSTILTVVVICAVVLLNVVCGILADRFPLNIDLTKDKKYSLSDKAMDVIKSVDKDVEIVVFGDESFFRDGYSGYAAEINVILRQYYEALNTCTASSGGKISVKYEDINADPALGNAYTKYGITNYDTLLVRGDKYQIIHLTDLLTQEANDYYGSSYTYTSKVEQALMSKLHIVNSDESMKMVFLTGHEENAIVLKNLKTLYTNNGYEVEEVNALTMPELGDDVDMVVIPAPAKDYTAEEVKWLSEWMNNDGKLGRNLFFMVNYQAEYKELGALMRDTYGITITDNLIQETDNNKLLMRDKYTSLVDIPQTSLTADIVGKNVVLGPTRQLIGSSDWSAEGDEDASRILASLVNYGDTARLVPMKDVLGDETSDEDTSVKADSYPVSGMMYSYRFDTDNNTGTGMPTKLESKVLVCGGMASVADTYLNGAAFYNEELLLNSINTILGNKDTVSISSKVVSSDTFTMTETPANILALTFIIIVPAVCLIICLVVFLKRRHL